MFHGKLVVGLASPLMATGCALISGPCRIESDLTYERASRTFACQPGGRIVILAPSRALDAAAHAVHQHGVVASEVAP